MFVEWRNKWIGVAGPSSLRKLHRLCRPATCPSGKGLSGLRQVTFGRIYIGGQTHCSGVKKSVYYSEIIKFSNLRGKGPQNPFLVLSLFRWRPRGPGWSVCNVLRLCDLPKIALIVGRGIKSTENWIAKGQILRGLSEQLFPAVFLARSPTAFCKKRPMLNQIEKANCESINTPNPGKFFGLVHEHTADALDNRCIVSAKVQERE